MTLDDYRVNFESLSAEYEKVFADIENLKVEYDGKQNELQDLDNKIFNLNFELADLDVRRDIAEEEYVDAQSYDYSNSGSY